MIQWIKKLLKKSNEKRDTEIQRIKEEQEEFDKRLRRECQLAEDCKIIRKIDHTVDVMLAEYQRQFQMAKYQGILDKIPEWEPIVLIPPIELHTGNIDPVFPKFKNSKEVVKEIMRLFNKEKELIKQQYADNSNRL